MPASGSARNRSPGRPSAAPAAQKNAEPTPSCLIVVLQALWCYFDMVRPVEKITGLITGLQTWVYGLLLPRLSADVQEEHRAYSLRVLELLDNATEKDIDKARRTLSAKYHPDNGSETDEEKMKEVNNAHDFLKEPMPLDLREATRDLASAIVTFVLTMLVLIISRYTPILGGDVFMMNPYTIGFFGRTYAQWPSLMSTISCIVISYCMGGVLVFPTVRILREYLYICNTIEWVLAWLPWFPASIAKNLSVWLSWFPSIFTWLLIWINWIFMSVLSNTLRFCDNWWTFQFIPIGQFVTLLWTLGMWYIHTLAFYNKYNPSQAIVVSNVMLSFGLIAVMGILLVWAGM